MWSRLALLVALVALSSCVTSCADGSGDPNEPNDDIQNPTLLSQGISTSGYLDGDDDVDVFALDATDDRTRHLSVHLEPPPGRHYQLRVGLAIPGNWEGVAWPGWAVQEAGGRELRTEGDVPPGSRVFILVSGENGAGSDGEPYIIEARWED